MTLSDTTADPNPSLEEVCDLPRDEREERSAMLRRELFPLVTGREKLADGWALSFADTPAMQQTLEDFVAFERGCCGSLSWNLTRSSGGELVVRVEGLSPDAEFFNAGFRSVQAEESAAEPPGATGGLTRLAQAAGLGTGAAFFFCCVVPMGVAAVASTAVAMEFAKLDDPLILAVASVVLAVPTWHWLKRRGERSAPVRSPDCC